MENRTTKSKNLTPLNSCIVRCVEISYQTSQRQLRKDGKTDRYHEFGTFEKDDMKQDQLNTFGGNKTTELLPVIL